MRSAAERLNRLSADVFLHFRASLQRAQVFPAKVSSLLARHVWFPALNSLALRLAGFGEKHYDAKVLPSTSRIHFLCSLLNAADFFLQNISHLHEMKDEGAWMLDPSGSCFEQQKLCVRAFLRTKELITVKIVDDQLLESIDFSKFPDTEDQGPKDRRAACEGGMKRAVENLQHFYAGIRFKVSTIAYSARCSSVDDVEHLLSSAASQLEVSDAMQGLNQELRIFFSICSDAICSPALFLDLYAVATSAFLRRTLIPAMLFHPAALNTNWLQHVRGLLTLSDACTDRGCIHAHRLMCPRSVRHVVVAKKNPETVPCDQAPQAVEVIVPSDLPHLGFDAAAQILCDIKSNHEVIRSVFPTSLLEKKSLVHSVQDSATPSSAVPPPDDDISHIDVAHLDLLLHQQFTISGKKKLWRRNKTKISSLKQGCASIVSARSANMYKQNESTACAAEDTQDILDTENFDHLSLKAQNILKALEDHYAFCHDTVQVIVEGHLVDAVEPDFTVNGFTEKERSSVFFQRYCRWIPEKERSKIHYYRCLQLRQQYAPKVLSRSSAAEAIQTKDVSNHIVHVSDIEQINRIYHDNVQIPLATTSDLMSALVSESTLEALKCNLVKCFNSESTATTQYHLYQFFLKTC